MRIIGILFLCLVLVGCSNPVDEELVGLISELDASEARFNALQENSGNIDTSLIPKIAISGYIQGYHDAMEWCVRTYGVEIGVPTSYEDSKKNYEEWLEGIICAQ